VRGLLVLQPTSHVAAWQLQAVEYILLQLANVLLG
jgi:hypothetical protein